MPAEGNNLLQKVLVVVLGGVLTATLALGGFMLNFVRSTETSLVAIQKDIAQLRVDFQLDKTAEVRQRIDKLQHNLDTAWQLHEWAKEEIDKLRDKLGRRRSRWPKFDKEE
jgi:uncharacterized protein (DUF3084 family)